MRVALRDAAARFAKRPADPRSWIPATVSTLAAPAVYAPHALTPDLDWRRVARAAPMRCSCRDRALKLLAAPQTLEFVDCARLLDDAAPRGWLRGPEAAWTVDAGRVEAAARELEPALAPGGFLAPFAAGAPAATVAARVARTCSGVAMWPALRLSDDVAVRARGPGGEPRRSSWQTVVALAPAARPASRVRCRLDAAAAARVDELPRYRLRQAWDY